MCAGIEFDGRRVLFSDPTPQLPILLKNGSVEWAQWGCAFADQTNNAPSGGWARLESIQAGKWKRYGAKPVAIPVTAFMERSPSGDAVWFPVTDGLAIQGAAIRLRNSVMTAELGNETVRIYVVTVQAKDDVAMVHDRMPRLIKTAI